MAVVKRTHEDALEWPSGSAPSLYAFEGQVSQALVDDGFCLIKAPTNASEQEALEQLANQEFPIEFWSRPIPDFAQAYFGSDEDGSSVMLKIDRLEERWPQIEAQGGADSDAWTKWKLASTCMYTLAETCSLIGRVAQTSLGFSSTGEAAQMMLRKQSPESTQAATEQDTIEEYLDFCRQQRVTLMSFIKVDGTSAVALNPVQQDEDADSSSIELLVTTGIILAFRQDYFNHCYRPSSVQDLVLQTWVLERDIQLSPAINEEQIWNFLGSPDLKLPRTNDPTVVSAGGHIPSVHGIEQAYNFFGTGCDCPLEIPILRWDHAPFYNEDESAGLALSKHLSLIDTYEMDTFDNEGWKIDRDHTQAIFRPKRKSLEVAYEVLYRAGFTRQTIQGANMSLGMGAFGQYDWSTLNTPTTAHCPPHSFVYFHLGLTGKCFYIDAACSATMNTGHELHRDMMIRNDGHEYGHFDKALNVGVNAIDGPAFLIGGTQSHMMGVTGRSSTFDDSANGYGGGEAISAYYFQLKDAEDEKQSDWNFNVTIPGTAAGNDGRSASLTAPNGPAQQLCFRQACQNSGMRPGEQVFHEYHGNGTKLGDAIEYGSVKAFFLGDKQAKWRGPLGQGAFKSFTAHPASAAGTTSLIKNIMCIAYGKITPNNHLREMNQNMDMSGYPHFIPTECLEYNYTSVYLGTVGMGFGGTNARVDLMGTATKGIRAIPGMASLPSGQVTSSIQTPLRRKLVEIDDMNVDLGDAAALELVIDSFNKKDLADDAPKATELVNSADAIYVGGSWSNWEDLEEMEEKTDENGEMCYFHTVTLDDEGRAEFQFVLDYSYDKAIYPVVEHGGPDVHIAGPDEFHRDRSWQIVGFPGETYKVKFFWDYDYRAIEWSPL